MKIQFFCYLMVFYQACQQSMPNLNGFWLDSYGQIIQIQKDSIFILDIVGQEKRGNSLHLTADSLNLYNPCLEDRQAYQLIQDTIFSDGEKVLEKINKDDIPKFFAGKYIHIDLKKSNLAKKDTILGSTYSLVTYPLLIGKLREDSSKVFFENGYGLAIREITLQDSLDFKAWLQHIENLQVPILLILYIDKDFPEIEKQIFCRTILNVLPSNAQFYEGFYAPESDLYMDFRKIK